MHMERIEVGVHTIHSPFSIGKRHMRLFSMHTFSASGNRQSYLGPVFRPSRDSDQHSIQIFLFHIGVPTFY